MSDAITAAALPSAAENALATELQAAFAAGIEDLPQIIAWLERQGLTPPAGAAHPLLDAHPYLGPAFELLPRRAEDAASLHGLFAFNYSALASIGLSASALSGLKHALPRLAKGVADQLFLDDAEALVDAFIAYDEPEFAGEWLRKATA